jgi:lipopolysaccharide biosynthesis protein
MYENGLKKITYDNGLLSYSEDKTMVQTLNDVAIVIHLYYVDIWMEIQSYLERVKIGYDLFITVTDNLTEKELVHIIKENPNANIYLTDNRGRDVLPFLHIMSLIGLDKYKYICKLHTKKSISNDNGDVWRKLLYYDLIGSDMIVKKILETFTEHNKVGQITGKNVVLDSIKYDFNNNLTVQHLSKMSNTNFSEKYEFSAGTMFWIRPEILKPIITLLQENKLKFENESGQTDNTLAHAVERFFGFLCKVKEYEIIESSSEYQKLPNATLEELAALAFFQRFEYGDLLTQIQIMKQQIQQKEQQIQEKEQILNHILNSKSIKLTHPLRQISLIVNTLISFN